MRLNLAALSAVALLMPAPVFAGGAGGARGGGAAGRPRTYIVRDGKTYASHMANSRQLSRLSARQLKSQSPRQQQYGLANQAKAGSQRAEALGAVKRFRGPNAKARQGAARTVAKQAAGKFSAAEKAFRAGDIAKANKLMKQANAAMEKAHGLKAGTVAAPGAAAKAKKGNPAARASKRTTRVAKNGARANPAKRTRARRTTVSRAKPAAAAAAQAAPEAIPEQQLQKPSWGDARAVFKEAMSRGDLATATAAQAAMADAPREGGRIKGALRAWQTRRAARQLDGATKDAARPAPTLSSRQAYKRLKADLNNRDLDSSIDMLKAMEQGTTKGTLVGKAWRKWRLHRATRRVRKTAVKIATNAIRTGEAADDARLQEAYDAMRPEISQNMRNAYGEIKRLAKEQGWSPAEVREAQRSVKQQLRQEIAENFGSKRSGYTKARAVLGYLEGKMKRYENKPVRRVLASLYRAVRGSPASSQRKLDRNLLKQVRRMSSQGIDGALGARMLLSHAAQRATLRGPRYARKVLSTQNKAEKNLTKAAKKAISMGDPAAVELAYKLKVAYQVQGEIGRLSEQQMAELGPEQLEAVLSDKQLRRMNKDVSKARFNLVSTALRQAEWNMDHPDWAARYGDPKEVAKLYATAARAAIKEINQSDPGAVGWRLRGRLRRIEDRTGITKASFAKRLARFVVGVPVGLIKMPFKVARYLTVVQAKELWRRGSSMEPPTDPALLRPLVERYLQGHMEALQAEAQSAAVRPDNTPSMAYQQAAMGAQAQAQAQAAAHQ